MAEDCIEILSRVWCGQGGTLLIGELTEQDIPVSQY